jgi:hypothetical protein
MKHDMYQVLKIAQERFWAKKAREAVTRVDNMKSVSPFTQFKYECMAVMSELHACAILKEVYPDRDFAPQAASHGGMTEEFFQDAKFNERPNGRSYYSGPVPRTTRGWVEYA